MIAFFIKQLILLIKSANILKNLLAGVVDY